ncbi:hypothetical protein FOL46_001554 [Perkinsus olseni]|uniref:RING-type domain-containing protein n=1 Tax=Perkinsus olseni TaxID=32597 RepID=A0A7J6MCB5_PEROL|nr:hypothetical protein FOL46_001554 [Perkinsus olseni]
MSDSADDDSVNLSMLLAAVGMIVAIIILLLCVCWRVHKYVAREGQVEAVRCHACYAEVEVPRSENRGSTEEGSGVLRVFLCRACMFANGGNDLLFTDAADVEAAGSEAETVEVAAKPSRLEMAIQRNEGKLFKLRKITTNFFRMKTVNSVGTPKTDRSKVSRDRNSYSSSSRKSLAASTAKTLMPGVCTVCFEETDTRLAFLPCGHSGICLDCMRDILRVLKGECHVCRRDIEAVVKVTKRRQGMSGKSARQPGSTPRKARAAEEATGGGLLTTERRKTSDDEYIGSALSVFDCELAPRPLQWSGGLSNDDSHGASQWSLRSFPRLDGNEGHPSSSSSSAMQPAGEAGDL